MNGDMSPGDRRWLDSSFKTINEGLKRHGENQTELFKEIAATKKEAAEEARKNTRDFGTVNTLMTEMGGHVSENKKDIKTINDSRASSRKWWWGIAGTLFAGVALAVVLLVLGLSS